ncbi:MAG: ABC transporter substrate-binding protein [Anaerolineaceae bacterium]
MKIKTLSISICLVLTSLLLMNCDGAISTGSIEKTALPVQVDTSKPLTGEVILDPAKVVQGNQASETIIPLIYEPLVRIVGGSLVGGLARSWQQSEDGLEYAISLRTDAVFADGTPITSDIVIANFNRWFDPSDPLHGSNDTYIAWKNYFFGFKGELGTDNTPLSTFDGIEKVDPLNLLIHLNRPMPEFLNTLAVPQFSIINTADLEKNGADFGTTISTTNPSGPYILSKWDTNSIELSPNQKYFGSIPQDNIVFTLAQ